jgi:hypothetical protein
MTFFTNRDINRLAVHAALVALAWSMAGLFFAVFLLRAGLPPVNIFLVTAAILTARFALRPLVIVAVAAIGLRRTLILGTALSALEYPAIAMVDGVGPALIVFCVVAATSQVFYWTCYHVYFASLGDIEHRGSQVGARHAIGALAAIIGPAAGGLILTNAGPMLAFGAASAIQFAAVVPLLFVQEPNLSLSSRRGAFAAAKPGVLLFAVDGWIQSGSATAWAIIMFEALASRYDSFGGVLAVAALAGSLAGMALGRFIDLGHARRSVWLNASLLAAGLLLKSACGNDAVAVVAVAIGTTLFAGLYYPNWMTAVYNAGKVAPCTFRFHFAAEGGWDMGGVLASLVAAAVCAAQLPLQVVILLALPVVALQALVVDASYAGRLRAVSVNSR